MHRNDCGLLMIFIEFWQVKSIIEEVVKSFRHKELQHKQTVYTCHTHCMCICISYLILQTSSLERELDFHKSVYQLQVNYVSSLFEAVRYIHVYIVHANTYTVEPP